MLLLRVVVEVVVKLQVKRVLVVGVLVDTKREPDIL
jgi:hypothetical protein